MLRLFIFTLETIILFRFTEQMKQKRFASKGRTAGGVKKIKNASKVGKKKRQPRNDY